MKALHYNEFRGPLRIGDLPDPTPPDDGVVIEVHATGICRSDWHGWLGHDPDIKTLPHVPGHEFAGVVSEVGSGVKDWQAGERVTMQFDRIANAGPMHNPFGQWRLKRIEVENN